MARPARTLLALLTTCALVAGVAVSATAASAESPAASPVQWPSGSGINYGYTSDWAAPANPAGLTGYRVRLYVESDVEATTALKTIGASPSAFTVTFTALTPGEEYFSTIVAVYAGGVTSEPVRTTDAQAFAPVGKVVGLTAHVANRKLVVSWTAPRVTRETGPIFGYLVRSPKDPYGVALDPWKTSATLTGLVNGRAYATTVLAIAGDLGPEARIKATPIGTPAKPRTLVRTWKAHGKTKLTWRPSKSTKAAPVKGYRVYVNGKLVKTVVGRKAKTATVKGQKRHKKYTFAVRAYNSVARSHAASVRGAKRPTG